ncbi:hypothetical protein [Brevundimonas sp. SL130]|uniref:hypothetical protein n=1 Tax=Brevundimonas sp. SL130 TaxID=2995143 RepID=UPI00226C904F|nr:hypothetical protein [Brevundimonas sp. SL130]WAC60813.1 hypothetical protein OU998_05030 [Brevundimonas sp. SL130]
MDRRGKKRKAYWFRVFVGSFLGAGLGFIVAALLIPLDTTLMDKAPAGVIFALIVSVGTTLIDFTINRDRKRPKRPASNDL